MTLSAPEGEQTPLPTSMGAMAGFAPPSGPATAIDQSRYDLEERGVRLIQESNSS